MRRLFPAIAGSALVATFFAVEGRLRQGEAARSFTAGRADRGTTRGVGAAFAVAVTAGPALSLLRRGRLPGPAGWLGVALMTGGLSLRIQAQRTLGAFYTRTLRTADEQQVVEAGPYASIRHPGYAGMLAFWTGYGLSLTSWPALAATAIPGAVAYHRRIAAEETMLQLSLGDNYRAYQRRTARLVPGLY
jgi:protein-S-isoprenylcysteine O-methyltransferase Ste14